MNKVSGVRRALIFSISAVLLANGALEAANKKARKAPATAAPAGEDDVYVPAAAHEIDQIELKSHQNLNNYVKNLRAQYENQLKEMAQSRDLELKAAAAKFSFQAPPRETGFCDRIPKLPSSEHEIYYPDASLLMRIEDLRSFQNAVNTIRIRYANKANRIRDQYTHDIQEFKVAGELTKPLTFALPNANDTGIANSYAAVRAAATGLAKDARNLEMSVIDVLKKVGQAQGARIRPKTFYSQESRYLCLERIYGRLQGLSAGKGGKADVDNAIRRAKEVLEQARRFLEPPKLQHTDTDRGPVPNQTAEYDDEHFSHETHDEHRYDERGFDDTYTREPVHRH
ncbi:MAG: hypothetical protein HYT79_09255 [Elusimicrobia bacterium]|nr:hypothetical protein [Elusimicrobiota bacterium]